MPDDCLTVDDASRARAEYARLLAEVRAGHHSAEAELVARLQPPLGAVLRHRTGNRQTAEDLSQETLIVVLRAAREGAVKEPEALVEFALGTARRLLLNESRKQQRQRTDCDEHIAESADADTPSVTSRIESHELQRRVATVLAELKNERDRQVLYAYYLQERDSVEVQASHNLDSLQLARILHRARKRFAALWNNRYQSEGEPT